MNKTLKSFVDYCEKNPELRFYQAITNWSGYNFIYGSMTPEHEITPTLEDLYYKEDEK
jgi:hypothetical protein